MSLEVEWVGFRERTRNQMRPRRSPAPRFSVAAMFVALLVPASYAGEADNRCDFYAYTMDPDIAGTNVRSGPGVENEVVAVLPQAYGQAGFAPEFHVVAFEDGWVKIEGAVVGGYDEEEKRLFDGPGWLSARLISFDVEDHYLRSAPMPDAEAVEDLRSESWVANGVFIEEIHGCEGNYVDVTVSDRAGHSARGWAGDLCANQATTCV